MVLDDLKVDDQAKEQVGTMWGSMEDEQGRFILAQDATPETLRWVPDESNMVLH